MLMQSGVNRVFNGADPYGASVADLSWCWVHHPSASATGKGLSERAWGQDQPVYLSVSILKPAFGTWFSTHCLWEPQNVAYFILSALVVCESSWRSQGCRFWERPEAHNVLRANKRMFCLHLWDRASLSSQKIPVELQEESWEESHLCLCFLPQLVSPHKM